MPRKVQATTSHGVLSWSLPDRLASMRFGIVTMKRTRCSLRPVAGDPVSLEAARANHRGAEVVELVDAERVQRAPTQHTFRAGDVVEFTDRKGKVVRGVVENTRGTRTVSVGVPDGGYRVPPSMLRKVEGVVRSEAGPMEHYTVAGYKMAAFASHETDCFECTIRYRDKLSVAHMFNEGQGGSDAVNPVSNRAYFDDFCAAVRQWCVWAGFADGDKLMEPEGFWLTWERTARPLGVTAQQFAAQHDAEMAALDSPAEPA